MTREDERSTLRARVTVLVVDDDDAVRRVTARALRRAGYDIVEAGGGREAVALARSHQPGVDLLLTDVVMPDLNGRELAERLQADQPDLKVLFISAYATDDVFLDRVRASRANFLPKPFRLEDLVARVDALVGIVPRD